MPCRLVALDFDGVFSDGKFFFSRTSGEPSKCYNAKDAYALSMLRESGIKTGLLTKDKSNIELDNAFHVKDRFDMVSIGDTRSKLEIVEQWCSECGITLEEVAYMGDDIPDIELLQRVGYSACPNDAIPPVKRASSIVIDKPGGGGAVREFAELIIQKVQECDHITAVIPVRKGSQRCKNKNIRNFGYESSLLVKKIKTLLKVEGIHGVLVTSDCDEMLDVAQKAGAQIHKRDKLYCNESSHKYTASNFFHQLGLICPTGVLMHVPCTTPFVSAQTYAKAISSWKSKSPSVDSVNSVTPQKHFMWHNNQCLNYDRGNPPKSQDLPEWVSLTFAFSILAKTTACMLGNVVGSNPQFVHTHGIEAIDIDDAIDFLAASQIERMGIQSYDDVHAVMREDKIERLDCTLRDGGYLNNWQFSDECVQDCYNAVAQAGFDYCEIGFRTNPDKLSGKGTWCYSKEEDIRRVFSDVELIRTQLVVMAKLGTVSLADFKHRKDSLVDMVRVLVPKCVKTADGKNLFEFDVSILDDMKEMVQGLLSLGYKVCVNLPCANSITTQEWAEIFNRLKGMNLHAVYLADTYGGCTVFNVTEMLHIVRKSMKETSVQFNIGFHSHNNQGDALEKTQRIVQAGATIIDSCISGLGRGAGNLESEVAALRFNNTVKREESIVSMIGLLEFIDAHILSKREYMKRPFAMRHPLYIVAGYLDLHPDYVDCLLKRDTSIREDVNTMIQLDADTRLSNERNFSAEKFLL